MAPVWEFLQRIRFRMCDALATFPAKVVAMSRLYGSAMFLAMAPASCNGSDAIRGIL